MARTESLRLCIRSTRKVFILTDVRTGHSRILSTKQAQDSGSLHEVSCYQFIKAF